MKYRYPALRTRQTKSEKTLVFIAPPATHVNDWAGVPQKKRFDEGAETAGFQRAEIPSRIARIRDFYRNQENLIQNPLLCATRGSTFSNVHFEPNDDGQGATSQGELIIEIPDFSALTMAEILKNVRAHLEERVPELKQKQPSEDLVARLKRRAADAGHIESEELVTDVEITEEVASEEQGDNGSDAESVLFEESHIVDFWQEVAARESIANEMDNEGPYDQFLGFEREALLAYLRPIVLVDGQHRLRGAMEAAKSRMDDEDIQAEIESRVEANEDSAEIRRSIVERESRSLPISLLMSDDPSEQVFQFVVVNQKATQIGRALLGTIVSTTLSNDEMARVAGRLKDAGIPLEESQAVTYLARHPESPFYGLVERGLASKSSNLLQWNVFASLIGVFRHLKGGKLFGQRNDYAEIWATRFLPDSEIIEDYESKGFKTPKDYWSSLDGPWRKTFIAFWSKVRDELGNTTDPDKHNYWGETRDSNLFNKISLTILAADFFQFLVETRTKIASEDDINGLVDMWLENVNQGYFDKNWNLTGVKKDSTGIRNRWAELWSEYRKSGGNLPDRRNFRAPKGD